MLPADLMALFETVGAGDTVARKKPAPDIYQWVLARLGLPPFACLAFEDSENGLKASLAAGLPTVGTQSGYTRDHHFAGALAVLSDLGGPGSSSVVHDGKLHGKAFVDLDLLRIWHRESISSN